MEMSLLIFIFLLSALPNLSIAQSFAQECLAPHNSARAAVGVPALVWDTTVATYAQNYANTRKRDCNLVHSSGSPYGENIAWSSGTSFSCADAVRLWVAEKADYNYNTNTCNAGKVCGHYTQVVWRKSIRLGCARVQCDNNRGIFVTCNYSPPGNYIGQRPY